MLQRGGFYILFSLRSLETPGAHRLFLSFFVFLSVWYLLHSVAFSFLLLRDLLLLWEIMMEGGRKDRRWKVGYFFCLLFPYQQVWGPAGSLLSPLDFHPLHADPLWHIPLLTLCFSYWNTSFILPNYLYPGWGRFLLYFSSVCSLPSKEPSTVL